MNTNLYTKKFHLILKICFHNIRGAPLENHWSRQPFSEAYALLVCLT
jgi:hypothetical protein